MTNPLMTKDGKLTPVADKEGCLIKICDPGWFDPKATFQIANAPERTAHLVFTGEDLNFAARVLYAEASGAAQLKEKAERDKEKAAILNVKHFRLNRPGYPSSKYIAKTFLQVCKAPNQFESVYAKSPKFLNSDSSVYPCLAKAECADLTEAIEAIKTFLQTGPNAEYVYDNFRGYNPTGQGTHIGRSRFWLSDGGKKLKDKTP
jgi:hypothetical protein